MADIDTDVTTAPVEQGTNDVGTEGATTQVAQTEVPKTFTQDEVNKLVQARLAEHGRTLKTKHEKELEAKIAETRDATQADLEKLVDERVATRIAETALNTARAAIAAEYGLNEDQAALLQGDTPEALTKHADKVFGALKQLPKPPIIKTGEGTASPSGKLNLDNMSSEEIHKNFDKLWRQAAGR